MIKKTLFSIMAIFMLNGCMSWLAGVDINDNYNKSYDSPVYNKYLHESSSSSNKQSRGLQYM